MSDPLISCDKQDRVAIVTLNNPKKLNAITTRLGDELVDVFNEVNEDDSISSIVLTGTGRAFCAGGDMHQFFAPKVLGQEPWDESDNYLGGLGWQDTIRLFRDSKPIIAAVNGLAVGGGATLPLPADIIIASEDAIFDFMFAKLGAVPELGSTHYLSARVGYGKALEILLTSQRIDANEALKIGLVSNVVSRESLVDTAVTMAKGIAQSSTDVLLKIKQLVDKNLHESNSDNIWQRESLALRYCFTQQEFIDKVEAFIKK